MAETRSPKDIDLFDYRQLHLFSSTVLYDTASKEKNKNFAVLEGSLRKGKSLIVIIVYIISSYGRCQTLPV